jgi:signal transduction histidine kinase
MQNDAVVPDAVTPSTGAGAHARYAVAGRMFATLVTILGIAYLADAVLALQTRHLTHFVLYAMTGIGAAAFMQRKVPSKFSLSANLFLVPLGIVELSLSETILLGIIGTITCAVMRKGSQRLRDSAMQLANDAAAAAAAFFVFHALIPFPGETLAIRLLLGSSAYFVTSTLPRAILLATTQGRPIGQTWKQEHFWSFPFYLVGASAASFLSIRNAFVHWEACVLTLPVLYVLYRAHRTWEADYVLLQQRSIELESAKTAAEAASRIKSEFLRNVSHEFRTPMNGIIGMTHVALENDLPEDVRDSLVTVKGCADSLLRLLNEILDLSKIEAGKVELEHSAFDVRMTVDVTCRPCVLLASSKGVQLHWHVGDDVPERLVGDPWRLAQVITNLLGNAAKFTHHGEIVLNVSVENRTQERMVLHFVVKDTGIGIPVNKQQAIFDVFTQADSSMTRTYGGTGLGLAICARLVEKMGGRIWVESEPGKGSAFHFTCDFALEARESAPPAELGEATFA